MQVGGALLLAIVTAILGGTGAAVHHALIPNMIAALAVIAAMSGGTVLLTAIRLAAVHRRPFPPGTSRTRRPHTTARRSG